MATLLALPPRAGVGFKPEHFAAINTAPQPIGFFEVHAENYMGAGGPPHAQLGKLKEDYALSIHGVGLSIGSVQPLDQDHLARLRSLCDSYQPESFSEHLAWSSHDNVFLNDLLPLPYTEETLARVAEHVDEVQGGSIASMLLENPATYLLFEESSMPEVDFLDEVARRTGCGLLLDVNNVFVSATNHGLDPRDYLASFPFGRRRGDPSQRSRRHGRRGGSAASHRFAQHVGARSGVEPLQRGDRQNGARMRAWWNGTMMCRNGRCCEVKSWRPKRSSTASRALWRPEGRAMSIPIQSRFAAALLDHEQRPSCRPHLSRGRAAGAAFRDLSQ